MNYERQNSFEKSMAHQMAYGAAETEYMYNEKCNFPWAIKTL